MESYVNLLSPIEKVSFTYNTNSNTTSADNIRKTASSQTSNQFYTPAANTLEDQWHGLLVQGPQAEHFDNSSWRDMQLYSESDYMQPWRLRMFESTSGSLPESPQTSSSSAFSSATCSPWETCPALAPANPEFRTETLAPGIEHGHDSHLFLSPEDMRALALEDLTLSPLRSAVSLPFHDAGMTGSFQPVTFHPGPIDTTNSLNNALDIDLSGNETPVAVRRNTDFSLSLDDSQTTPVSANGPSQAYRPLFSHSVSEVPPPLVEESAESKPSSNEGFASDNLLNSRATRRKSSQVVFSDEDYMEDSDDDYAEEDESPRKRRRKSRQSLNEGSSTSSDYGDEHRGSPSSACSPGKKGKHRTFAVGEKRSNAGSKRKTKRRHYCPREGCQSSFTRYTDMERHLATVHRLVDTEANRCSFCHKAFSRDDAVLRHENDSCPVRPRKKRSGSNIWL